MIKQALAIFAALILTACSSGYQAVTQVSDKAYLQLEGQYLNTQLVVDNLPAITIRSDEIKTFNLNGKQVVRFPIATGSHAIKIIKAGKTLVNRKIYVSNNNVFEVVIP